MNVETMYNTFRRAAAENVQTSAINAETLKTLLISHSTTVSSLEQRNQNLEDKFQAVARDNTTLKIEVQETKTEQSQLQRDLGDLKESHAREISDLKEKHARDRSNVKEGYLEEISKLRIQHNEAYSSLKEKFRDETHFLEQQLSTQATASKDILIEQANELKSDFQNRSEQQSKRHQQQITALEEALRLQVQREQETIKSIENDAEARLGAEHARAAEILVQASTTAELQKQQQQLLIDQKDQQLDLLTSKLRIAEANITEKDFSATQARQNAAELQNTLNTTINNLQTSNDSLNAKIRYLESDQKSQSQSYAAMEEQRDHSLRVAAVERQRALKLETHARKLRDEIENLKGNIRVVCRQRPALISDGTSPELATVDFPDLEDMKSIEIRGPEEKSSLGTITTKTHPFTFDKAFGPQASNDEIFEEIEPKVQSAIDGYNVCLFAYGQTGSGKTHTMSSHDGMMPRATRMIYERLKELEELGWQYCLQGSFLEIYNENINDLLGDPDEIDKKKHEIRHDTKLLETTITDITVVDLDSEESVTRTVDQAMSRRTIAATKLNERSSRSHSVFILKLHGHNPTTGEISNGTLNLVDLAGSERVAKSQVSGDRLKEAQNINKSLSCLKDVIAALSSSSTGQQTSHIPYRNSKLTYLLQYSLGGNSKTLMFVMVSPLKEHLGESLSSLKFATMVHNTHIGAAKKVK